MSKYQSMKTSASFNKNQAKQVIGWTDSNGVSALHIAVQDNNLARVLKLVKLGADCNAVDADGNTPLHYAAQCGNFEILNSIAEAAEDLDVRNNAGETPVLLAAHSGSIGAVVALTSMDKHVVPADTSVVDRSGRTFLMHACISGDIDLVRLILAHRDGRSQQTSIAAVAVNAVDENGKDALMHAATEGHWHLISLLVLFKANVAAKDLNGLTALHHAASQGTASTVSALLDCGARINDADISQWTPLMHAVNEENLESAQLLVDCGASPDHAIALAKSRAMHLTICDAIRDSLILRPPLGPPAPITLSGRMIVTLLNASDLYVDPTSVTDGTGEILVYGVVQFKASGDSDDSEMIGITEAVRCTKEMAWAEPIVFFLKNKKVRSDCVFCIDFFATRDHRPITELYSLEHAAGEDEGGDEDEPESGEKRQTKMDSLYREIQKLDDSEFLKKQKLEEYTFSELKKRWNELTESRKRLLKYTGVSVPLPPVPETHFPCGSIRLSLSNLREIFRASTPGKGHPVEFKRFPRCADRGLVRFEIDYVASFVPVVETLGVRTDIPQPATPREAELPPIVAPPELFDFEPAEGDLDIFATRSDKFKKQNKEHYVKWWSSMSMGASGIRNESRKLRSKTKRRNQTFREEEAELIRAVNMIAQSLLD